MGGNVKRILGFALAVSAFVIMMAVSILMQTEESEAIPAFARKYRMTCNTCHAPVPRLKAYGDDFAGNGFVLEDQEAPRYYVETGDENLSLIRDFPFAMRLEGYAQHRTETGKETDFTFPYNVKLLSGGEITDDIAYYLYFFLSEHGEVAGLEDAYVMFNNIGNSELDIYVGQFQVSDPLFKREVRLTYEDYEVYKYAPGVSQIDLKYDRGVMLTYGLESGTDIILEILNGNGIGEADDDKVYDADKYKSGVVRLSQDIGEYLRAGVVAYYGQEGSSAAKNEVRMGGIDATISAGPAELNVQYMRRDDTNPLLMTSGVPGRLGGTAGLAELILMPDGDRSRVYAVGMYNFVDRDDSDPIYHSVTGHVGYMLRTNIRAFFENTYHIETEENRAVLGLMTAF
jgi:hypothetical protein